jgi:Domain of unknown function (DUF4864)
MRKFLIFILIPCGLGWWFWGRTLEPAKVVHAQLEAISQHDYQKAYSYLSAGTKSRLPFESFQEMVQKNPVVANNYTSEFLSRKMEHNTAIRVNFSLERWNTIRPPFPVMCEASTAKKWRSLMS